MLPVVALLIATIYIFVLLDIDRKQNRTASVALWIPTAWLLIAASRPMATWFADYSAGAQTAEIIEAGSPYDRMILSVLILLALYVLNKRKVQWAPILKENSHLVFLIIFAGLSLLWSDFPFLSMKRWIRIAGLVPVSMVILSEASPVRALESIFRRCAFVLIPLSMVLIKYFPHIGRSYGRWSGVEYWTGVTLTKNMLGQLCAFSAIFLFWECIREWSNRRSSRSRLDELVVGPVFVIAIYLLYKSDSVTSILALLAGVLSILLLYGMKKRAHRVAALLIIGTVIIWILAVMGGSIISELTQAAGRNATFTDRTDIWLFLLREGARHPLLGAGFGGYFGTPGNEFFAVYGMNWAHNGLLRVYVELGLAGIILTLAFYISLYGRFRKELDQTFGWSVFGLCFLVMSGLVSFSENLFLEPLSYPWSMAVLMAILFSRLGLINRQTEEDS
jgi:exopolysaccharide production protein ExoQ